MIILGIETSCDETAVAILEEKNSRIQILSNVVASSASLQSKYGGIIPEQAAREQVKAIIPVIQESLQASGVSQQELDTIAVTYGPGLIGSLLVGVETAKVLATVWKKPLIKVNHLIGHFYANWINQSAANSLQLADKKTVDCRLLAVSSPKFPCLGLLVSGGHTDLVLFISHSQYQYLGGTRDDAAGECFDKCARLLNLPYPGGPAIAQKAMEFKIKNSKFKIKLPRPLIHEKTFDFSFSGLKTATLREVEQLKKTKQFNNQTIQQLSFEIQEAITDVLVTKTIAAAQKYHIEQIIVAGGVAANLKLTTDLNLKIKNLKLKIKVAVPPPYLCTDNGAMIAAAAFFLKPAKGSLSIQADPGLSW